jgi:lysozyme family protein
MNRIQTIIENTIGKEGRYSNNPKDSGGETMWGITAAVARANGYTGAMKNMPRETAVDIYTHEYFIAPGYDKVLARSASIAEELFDTGVNMHPLTASRFLQRALNALNRGQVDYPDVVVDGKFGAGSLKSFDAFLKLRGAQGEVVLLRILNAMQCARYVELAETRVKDKEFVFGWVLNRVVI